MAIDCEYDMNRLNHIGDDLVAAFNDGYAHGKADAEKRANGVWLTGLVKDSDGSVRRTFSFCSICNLLVEKETNYCPNCGAKMGIE